MRLKNSLVVLLISAVILTACTNGTENSGGVADDTIYSVEVAEPDSVLTPLFAKYFRIEYYPTYKVAVVLNPWDSAKVMARHKITKPVESVAAGSCSHVAFIANLNSTDKIKGVCSSNLIYNPTVREALKNGVCRDLGDSFSVNFEPVMMLKPSLFFATAYNQPDQHIERLKEAGINIVSTVEWIEPDILGRAEWIKFIAAFFNKEREADSLFNSVMSNYDRQIERAANAESTPSILPGLTFKGVWYMPAGNSYMSRLFSDAGGLYHFSDNSESGSLPLSFEYVLQNFNDCDIWIGLDIDTYAELLESDSRLKLFKPYKTRKAYNKNKRKLSGGANDFWENGVVHPEWVLYDLVTIFHPDMAEDGDSTIFMAPLQ